MPNKRNPPKNLSIQLQSVYDLLKKVQPIENDIDVGWQGPFYIPRRGLWCPSRFTLYRGTLYCQLFIPPGFYNISWSIASHRIEYERQGITGDYCNNDLLWADALGQIRQRLKIAVKDTEKYNQSLEKDCPFSCRTGKIRRGLTWPSGTKSALPLQQIKRFKDVVTKAGCLPTFSQMTVSLYLDAIAVAYDAVFKELRRFSPLEKYKKKADGRHGGLLDLPPQDPGAFSKWFHSREWAGSHPWEIVFGHPHGIMISPHHNEGKGTWNFCLWVDALGWYGEAARMAIALGDKNIPFEFVSSKEVLEALEGLDEVDVGPDLYSVHYQDLKKTRPDALPHIRWDTLPWISLITPEQKKRIEKAEQSGGSGK